jgi:CheY-like chemotaxis protein
MPGWDGPQTLAAIRTINPDVRFCFMTGHAGDYSEEQLLALGASCVLQKPFNLDELVRNLEQLTRLPTQDESHSPVL